MSTKNSGQEEKPLEQPGPFKQKTFACDRGCRKQISIERIKSPGQWQRRIIGKWTDGSEVEMTYFTCPHCGTEYPIAFTNSEVIKRLNGQTARQEKLKKFMQQAQQHGTKGNFQGQSKAAIKADKIYRQIMREQAALNELQQDMKGAFENDLYVQK